MELKRTSLWGVRNSRTNYDNKNNWRYTPVDLANCTEFSAVTGYNYQTYFKIEDMSSKLPDADLLNIKLYVLATKDAHVLLSTEENPPASSNVYEIGKTNHIILF